VLVIAVQGSIERSVFGGMAATGAKAVGLAGCLVDGGVRDLDEIAAVGLPLWARSAVPATGAYHFEAVEFGTQIEFAGVQVHAGDIVVADQTGICFIALEIAEEVLRSVAESD